MARVTILRCPVHFAHIVPHTVRTQSRLNAGVVKPQRFKTLGNDIFLRLGVQDELFIF